MSDRLPRRCDCGVDVDELDRVCGDCARDETDAYFAGVNPSERDAALETHRSPLPRRWGNPNEPRHAGPRKG